jgi:hypothetical protein
VLQAFRHQVWLRRCIGAAATVTLALHVLLSPLSIGKPAPGQAGANGDVFVICHGAGTNSDADQDGPAQQPTQDAHCVLCTLTHNGCAVLPGESLIVSLDPGEFLQLIIARHAQVTEHHSPTGEYQRGPPTHTLVAG